ncbi:hypothetical protein NB717_001849 [Xanthomonas sacchari]|nr:hypothetical protein [Xanthomonas sacchari]MCW0423252.1 hypothetical protein [Xanthomonas sacchari]MCW0449774.1 hypothetical protein [Xanthomonas sacchari]MCW0460781.1 hypothetical protein [Xanthomonas sacchari]
MVLIGVLLDALAYRDGHCLLLCWAMAAGPLLCGALCLLLALLTGRRRSHPIGAGLAANASSG